MEIVAPDPEPVGGAAGPLLARSSVAATADRALLELGRGLKEGGYRFTVEEMEGRRIRRIQAVPVSIPEASTLASAEEPHDA